MLSRAPAALFGVISVNKKGYRGSRKRLKTSSRINIEEIWTILNILLGNPQITIGSETREGTEKYKYLEQRNGAKTDPKKEIKRLGM